METINLKSYNGRIITVKSAVARMSETIRMAMELAIDNPRDNGAILIENVSGDILEKVVSWMEHYHEVVVSSPTGTYVRGEWDDTFFKMEPCDVFELYRAVLNLNVTQLMEYANDLLRGKSAKEIRTMTGL